MIRERNFVEWIKKQKPNNKDKIIMTLSCSEKED